MRDWKTILMPGRSHGPADGTRPRSRALRALAVALVLFLGGVAASSVSSDGDRARNGGSRLDAFRENAPRQFSLFDGWWNRSESENDAAFELITEEVREEFFEEIPYGEIIHAQAVLYEVDPMLVAAIVEVESAFDTRARSPRGAVGLMQLRPATARWMGASNLLDPAQNIAAGTKYLKYLEERFDGDLDRQLAAYNAGEGVVRRYGGVPPYPETICYIRRVSRRYEQRNRELERFSEDWLERENELEAGQ